MDLLTSLIFSFPFESISNANGLSCPDNSYKRSYLYILDCFISYWAYYSHKNVRVWFVTYMTSCKEERSICSTTALIFLSENLKQ